MFQRCLRRRASFFLAAAFTPLVRQSFGERHAGGVYYTPKYIVDYIVEHTIGKLIQDKTPRRITRMRFCDPACGSGSFLIGAYRKLLDYHRDWYLSDGTDKHRKRIHQGAGGQWYLTTEEKKRILLNNIYGVDIDPQAVEVTKLNLLLCVLENENQASIRQLALFHQRALPDLGNNIKCGNSLIGSDFYAGRQLTLFDDETKYKINAFDWEDEFPEIFKRKKPGFDAVIGNPPYLSFSGRQAVHLEEDVHKYLFRRYDSKGWATSHGFFLERSVKFLSRRFVSFILPDQVGHLKGYVRLRESVTTTTGLVDVRYWGEKVFRGVTTPSLTLVADKRHRGDTTIREADVSPAKQHLSGSQAWKLAPRGQLFQTTHRLGRRRFRRFSAGSGRQAGCAVSLPAAAEGLAAWLYS